MNKQFRNLILTTISFAILVPAEIKADTGSTGYIGASSTSSSPSVPSTSSNKSVIARSPQGDEAISKGTTSSTSASIDTSNTSTSTDKGAPVKKASAMAISSAVSANDSSSGASSAGVGTNVQSASVQVEPSSGSASLSVPITVPAGRAGIQPNLALVYNSGMRQLGNAGVGWNLDLGSIQISTKKGIPKYDGKDIFTMSQNGGTQDLVADPSTANHYYMETEGSFANIQYITDHWVITDKKGIKYYYGNTDDSKQYDTSNASRIFRWALNRVEDLNGNYMIISYLKDNGQIYPQTISYTGNDTASLILSTYAQVSISYVSAAQSSVFYISGFGVTTAQRIDHISVSVGANIQSTYTFTYKQSDSTQRDLLQSVQQTGADGRTSLPPVSFTYSDAASSFAPASTITNPFHGDNLWEFSCNGGYDHGHNNYGVMQPNNFGWGTVLSGPYIQSSGNAGTGNWSIDSKGNLSFQGHQDSANQFWTYLYVKTARTLSVPITGADVGGAFVNNYTNVGSTWPLQAGWNVVYITLYNQNQGINYNLNYELADQVDLMNSTQLNLPQIAGDFDGDGRSDIGTFNNNTGTFNVALSQGGGFAGSTAWISGFGVNQNIITGDFNGDGRTDIAYYDSSSNTVRVALSDGTKFVDSGVWLNTGGVIPASPTVLAGDFDGDGLEDLAFVYKDGSGNWYARIAKNIGGAFQLGSAYSLHVGSSSAMVFAADMNGDGLTDLVGFDQASGTWSVHLNTNGFNNTGFYSTTGFGVGQTPVLGDFNQDGMADIGYYRTSDGVTVYLPSVVNGFSSQQQTNFASSLRGSDTEVQGADFNGDGAVDYMVSSSAGQNEIFNSQTLPPNEYLTHIDNGIGGTTDITYDSSAHYQNKYMPFVEQVVKSVTISDSFGHGYTTKYSYANGYYDTAFRESDGFQTVTITDPEGNYATTTYLQDHWLKGHPSEQDTYGTTDGSHWNLYSKSVNQWQAQTIVTNTASNQISKFPYVSRTDNYLYDGNSSATPKRTAKEFHYNEGPQYGDVTQIFNDGQVDPNTGASIDPNKTITQMDYVYNTNNWLIGLPKDVIISDINGYMINYTMYYYDGDTTGFAVPSLGRLTAKVNWLHSSTQGDPKTTYTYDPYGNLQTTTDPNGNTTTIVYDNTVHMFPEQTINALKQTVTMTYYGIDNALLDDGNGLHGLWGQQRSKTDANNQTAYTTYDVFGRSSTSISPLDSVALPTEQKVYNIQSTFVAITDIARQDNGSSATISTVSYYDGLGRLIETKSLGPTAGRFIISGQTIYDDRGLPVTKYLPRFTTNDLNTVDPIDTSVPSSQAAYDPMGRVTTKTNPDSTYSSVSYDQWTTTSTDENGHMQKSYVDAFGRLVQKEEYTGADGRSPYYPTTPYALYATTKYSYDPKGDLTSVTDNKSNITTITYDNLGRKIAMNDPDMGKWQYGYDGNGNLIWQQDAKTQVISFQYDALNRLKNKTDAITGPIVNLPNLPLQPATFNVNYNFDDPTQNYGIGRLGSVNYDSGKASFIYDQLGREVSSNKNVNGANYNVTRQYDALNRLKQLLYPDGAQVAYTYNQAGQVIGVADSLAAFVATPQSLPTVNLTAPANNAVFVTPANIAISATVTETNGTITQVQFFNGTTLLGTSSTSPYNFSWSNVPVGTYSLTAVAIDANGVSTTSSPITVNVYSTPVITTQPVSATVSTQSTASFSLAASGTPAPSYQWMQMASGAGSFTAISTATSAAYTTPALTAADNGTQFECVVTNAAGPVTSNVVTLTVSTDGVCGTANKTYAATTTSFGSDTLCSAGNSNPATVAYPGLGQTVSWTCQGINGGANSSCSAKRNTYRLMG